MTDPPGEARGAARGEISRSGHGTDGVARGIGRRPSDAGSARRVPWSRPCSRVRCATPISSRPGCSAACRPVPGWPRCRRGRSTVVGVDPAEVVVGDGRRRPSPRSTRWRPGSGSAGARSSSGHAVERVVARGRVDSSAATVPDVVFARFDALAVIDARRRASACEGAGPAARCSTHAVAAPRASRRPRVRRCPADALAAAASTATTTPTASTRSLELLRAGECYQVNLTRRLTCDDALDPVALYARARARAPGAARRAAAPPELGGGHVAVVSASPELFLRRRGAATSRPGRSRAPRPTRAALRAQRQGPRRERDDRRPRPQRPRARVRARVRSTCPTLCAVEAHPGLHHLVSTVRGHAPRRRRPRRARRARRSRPRRSPARRSRACSRRSKTSSRCGAASTAARSAGSTRRPRRRDAELAVAIRTFTVLGAGRTGARTSAVGGGIVADSSPDAEWAETELKAARLLAVAGARTRDAGADAAMPVGT